MRILLIGLMGSGKTTVGRRLSRETGWLYLDNDALLREVAGMTAPELIVEQGEDGLHLAELEAFERALAAPEPSIVGVAGWIVVDPEARARLRGAGTVVWLRAQPATLLTRTGAGTARRPDAVSGAWIGTTAAERAPWFAEAADVIIDVDRQRPREVVERLLALPGVSSKRG
jgi:shikimate kinase